MRPYRLAALFLLVPLIILAMGSFQTVDAAALKVMQSGDQSYLADSNGRTLYIFMKDASAQTSTCVGQCIVKWPIFYTEKIMVPAGMDAVEFGVITHPSGQKQTTFRGWPLYYFADDMAPGQLKGQGFNGIWFIVMNPKNY